MPKSRSVTGRAEMSRPACSTVPRVWRSSPAMARRSVVLPQPEGPRKQTNSPSLTSSDTSRRAWKLPKAFHRLRILRNTVGSLVALALIDRPSAFRAGELATPCSRMISFRRCM